MQQWSSGNALDSDQCGPGFKAIAGHWRRQEGHLVLNARARTKVLLEVPSKPQGIGGNGGKIKKKKCKKNAQ